MDIEMLRIINSFTFITLLIDYYRNNSVFGRLLYIGNVRYLFMMMSLSIHTYIKGQRFGKLRTFTSMICPMCGGDSWKCHFIFDSVSISYEMSWTSINSVINNENGHLSRPVSTDSCLIFHSNINSSSLNIFTYCTI